MAESLDDGEFWLPPQFLTDDDLFMDKDTGLKVNKGGFALEPEMSKASFPFEFPYGFGSFGGSSDLSSPVESVVGSTETESDEEEYLAGLTRKMAHSTLEDDFMKMDSAFGTEHKKGRFISGSPQSTLCAVGSGCRCRQGSNGGSPNDHSLVSPPGTWDLLYAAAGEVAKMRMDEEQFALNHSRGLLGPSRKPSPVSIPVKNFGPQVGFYTHHSLSHQKLQAAQFEQLKQQQMMKQQNAAIWAAQSKGNGHFRQQRQNHSVVRNNRGNLGGPLGLSSSAWPSLQQAQEPHQQSGSGMRAMFLGTHGMKRESTGTGVFLPRRPGIQTETRKKPACSTVLLPARVVQALNLNLDDIGAQPQLRPRVNASFTPEGDAALLLRGGDVGSHQRRNMRPQPGTSPEVRLPPEWTY